jgi:hypothetical protein
VTTETFPGLLRKLSCAPGKFFPWAYDGLPIFNTDAVPYTGLEEREKRR